MAEGEEDLGLLDQAPRDEKWREICDSLDGKEKARSAAANPPRAKRQVAISEKPKAGLNNTMSSGNSFDDSDDEVAP